MSTATTQPKSTEIAILLNKALDQAPQGVVAQGIEKALASNIAKFRDTLPTQLRSEAERFVRRAIIYYQTAEPKTKLHLCTPQSFIMCVLEAAEIGLPLDGKLCHAIAYNNKKQDAKGKDYWEHEATCMPDYKGLIAVAKRAGTGTVKDIYAEIVCENDDFTFERTESVDKLSHTYPLFGDRGKVVGCYAKVQLPNGSWRFEILRRSDIDQIRGKSKAATSGPWKDEESSDWNEMAKKTGIKRILKGFMDDPGVARAMELDDRAIGYITEEPPQDTRPKIDRLAERLLGTGDDRRECAPTSERPNVHGTPEHLRSLLS